MIIHRNGVRVVEVAGEKKPALGSGLDNLREPIDLALPPSVAVANALEEYFADA